MKKFLAGLLTGVVLASASAALAFLPVQFKDIPPDAWYTSAVNRLSSLGIIQGYSDSTFRPNNNVSRGEVAVMFDRLLNYFEIKDNVNTYTDAKLGISFSYPKEWETLDSNEAYEQYILMIPALDGISFLVGNNPDPSIESPGRGGYWGDTGKEIKSEEDVQNYCNDKDTCRVYQNQNGITIAKFINQRCLSEGCEEEFNHVEYYFYNPNSPYSGTVLSTYSFKTSSDEERWNLEKQLDLLTDSIKFIQ